MSRQVLSNSAINSDGYPDACHTINGIIGRFWRPLQPSLEPMLQATHGMLKQVQHDKVEEISYIEPDFKG